MIFFQMVETKLHWDNEHYFWIGDEEMCQIFKLFHFTKVFTKPSLKGSTSVSNIMHAIISFSSSYNKIRSDDVQSISL